MHPEPPSPKEVVRFAQIVEQKAGLRCEDCDLENLALVLRARVEATDSLSVAGYLRRLPDSWKDELRGLAPRLTITESHFFRGPAHVSVLFDLAIPELRRDDPNRVVRILSAGCARGEEPFTIAIALLEQERIDPARVEIVGFDLNPESVAFARAGRCSSWSLRGVPDHLVEKYFRREGDEYVVCDRVRDLVTLEERNIVDRDPRFWRPNAFDVIFCRNVLMYLSQRALDQVMASFAESLCSDGFLFLGHAESLLGMSHDFRLQSSNGEFFYRRNSEHLEAASSRRFATGTYPRPAGDRDQSVQAQADNSDLPAPGASHALATVGEIAPNRGNDPDLIVITAALLAEQGKLDQAEELCTSVLASDSLNPAAHYLMAFWQEQRGKHRAAVEGYRTAIHLDPSFAIPHLRLALALKSEGSLEDARVEFEHAELLIGREDPARLLVYAGGFSRRALLDQCRSELRKFGGAS